MYQYKAVFQSKQDQSFYFLPVVAFTKKSLNEQIMRKWPTGYRFIRVIDGVPGSYDNLHPAMPDMVMAYGGPDPDEQ